MKDFYSIFPKSSKEEWIALLEKELKGESLDKLSKTNHIEEITFPSYFHQDDKEEHFSDPNFFPFTRGYSNKNNEWYIASNFCIEEEKATNKEVLSSLMSGTTHVILEAQNSQAIDFSILLKDIGLSHILTTLHAKTIEQVNQFLQAAGTNPVQIILENQHAHIEELIQFSHPSRKLFHVDGSSVQQAGSTSWQEIAISIAEGHELLVRQLDLGIDIDTAASSIHFSIGIGNKFYFELAKFRAFRTCWSEVIQKYSPKTELAYKTHVCAKSTFVNISLKDSYTNLLRQTTEAMSAVLGGVSSINIRPFDWHAKIKNYTFSRRMATNISLLLKEESYLNKVIDVAGGSYALDYITSEIVKKAWELFLEIENQGGITNESTIKQLKANITSKAEARLIEYRSNKEKLIGINIFPNPEKSDNTWESSPTCWNNLNPLIIEQNL